MEDKKMISYDLNCISCKKAFKVHAGSIEYQKFKTKSQKYFWCPSCKETIERNAKLTSDFNIRIIESIDKLSKFR